MLSFLYVYSDHSILECYNLFSGVELSMRSFFVIRKVSRIVLSRCYFQNLCGNVIARYLCGFCDASIIAFAACTYLVIVTDQGLHSSLVASKTHVAPIDQQSVPCLELSSAVLLARLIVTVEEAFEPILQIDTRLYSSDSTTTLQWIKNEERERELLCSETS